MIGLHKRSPALTNAHLEDARGRVGGLDGKEAEEGEDFEADAHRGLL